MRVRPTCGRVSNPRHKTNTFPIKKTVYGIFIYSFFFFFFWSCVYLGLKRYKKKKMFKPVILSCHVPLCYRQKVPVHVYPLFVFFFHFVQRIQLKKYRDVTKVSDDMVAETPSAISTPSLIYLNFKREITLWLHIFAYPTDSNAQSNF